MPKYRRGFINIDELAQIIKDNGQSISESPRGRKVWIDITEWEDSNLTLSFYNGTTRTEFGKSIKEQNNEKRADNLW